MVKRIVFGSILIALLVAMFWLDWTWSRDVYDAATGRWVAAAGGDAWLRGVLVAAVMGVISLAAVREMAGFSKAVAVRLLPAAAVLGSLALVSLPYWARQVAPVVSGGLVLATVTMVLAAVFGEQMAHRQTEGAFARIAATALTVLYIGGCGGMIVEIRMQYSTAVLILFLAAVKCTDIGAYFTGSMIGRHKLIPWLSPGKSWQGLAGGLIAAALVSGLLAWVLGVHLSGRPLAVGPAALFGACVGLMGQFADLCESLLKRSAGTKDSGALVPEFGGVLDMLDSPLLAAPLAYLLLAWLG